jgi:NAD(P)-dependent dehydrogenase (short-subunit alcohol dehydrogenase family)
MNERSSSLDGKVAVITGGGSGIGRAIAQKYLDEGAKVSLGDLYEERLASFRKDAMLKKIEDSRILTCAGDVSNYDVAGSLIQETQKTFGKVDILVNNAGGSYGVGGVEFAKTEKKSWDITVNGNLYSTFNCVKHTLPLMIEKSTVG